MRHSPPTTPLRTPQTPPRFTAATKLTARQTPPAALLFCRHHRRHERLALAVHPHRRGREVLFLFGLVGAHEAHVEGAGELARVQSVRGPFYWVVGLGGLRGEELRAQARGADVVGGGVSREGDGAGFGGDGGGGEVFLAG
jgi:hypothetical protein